MSNVENQSKTIPLKIACRMAGFTQTQLARTLGVSRYTVVNYVAGRTIPDVMTAMKISELLNIDIKDIDWECKNL